MKKLYSFLILFFIYFGLSSQVINNFDDKQAEYTPIPSEVMDNFNKAQSGGATINWEHNFIIQADGSYHFLIKAPIPFTSFGVGWQTSENEQYPVSSYIVKYRSKIKDQVWGKWFEEEGYVKSNDTPTGLYWTDLLFMDNELQHHEIELIITPPSGVSLSYVRLALIDITSTETIPEDININSKEASTIQDCPALPTINGRSTWCGSYTACHNTTSYTNITATHTVIHHGASPDTYTDGAAVVRSYWNYHVNTLGWADIGYNYLLDKLGNIYQGRYNPNMPNTDVKGAHAGNANSGSIGINFLGNADVTLPTTVQLNKLKELLAWWYDYKGFDPTSSAGMTTQAFGWQVKPRICGHRDVGETTCPGTTLYNYLPSIRTGTKSIIDACSYVPPTGPSNLQIVTSDCPDITFTCSWTNSGTGWYIQISTSSDYSNPYWKWVSNLTTYTGPTGYVLQSNGSIPLTIEYGTTYYWRIWDGTNYTEGPSFTTPYCDIVPPTTSISTPGNWKTEDFIATFMDADNLGGSGISRKYYQVLDFDGTYWRANANCGFFADNFDNLEPTIWTVPTAGGTWTATNGMLVQSDETLNNTNIYAALNQTLSNRYLYNFQAKIEGASSTTSRRMGFHYFCDNGALENRGNSYFIWFKIETNKMEFYKVTNNVFSMIDEIDDIVTAIDSTYDYKVIYDRITGEHIVYRNDILLGAWTDTNPLSTNGDYISFRTGNSKLSVNELKVYRTRANTASITLGNSFTKDIRYQNASQAVSSAKIKSIVIDSAGHFSDVNSHDLNIDWTNPSDIVFVHDGLNSDIDTNFSYTQIQANWSVSSDSHSDIADYWYCIGTSPESTNIVNWTNNGTNTSLTHFGLNLDFNTIYYVSVKSRNNAGLFSNIKTSNGQLAFNMSSVLVANFEANQTSINAGSSVNFTDLSTNNPTSWSWIFEGGTPGSSTDQNPSDIFYNTPGVFNVTLVAANTFGGDTLLKTDYIRVNLDGDEPISEFTANQTIINAGGEVDFTDLSANTPTEWQWTFEGGTPSSSFEPNPTNIQYNLEGTFYVSLIARNSFGWTLMKKDHYITVLPTTSILENNLENSLLIYPNPASTELFMELEKWIDGPCEISLMNTLGQKVRMETYPILGHSKKIITWNISGVAKGVYYIKFETAKLQITKKLIVYE